jgi:hypothetical protein
MIAFAQAKRALVLGCTALSGKRIDGSTKP